MEILATYILAIDTLSQKSVAIKKIYYLDYYLQKEKMSFLAEEIKILSKVNHPHIIQLIDVYHEFGNVYQVLELMENGNLYDFITTNGAVNENEARKWMRQIVSAVEYLHCNLIAHLDLRLENLLLDRENNVIITDFGISKVVEPGPGQYFLKNYGNPIYNPPEVLKSKLVIGFGVDIWSLGVILFVLLSKRFPFDGDNSNSILSDIEGGVEINDDLSDECRDLIYKIFNSSNEEDRIKLNEIKYHPWLDKGFFAILPSYLKNLKPIDELNDEIIDQLSDIFFYNRKEVSKMLLSNINPQLSYSYHLLLDKLKKKRKKK